MIYSMLILPMFNKFAKVTNHTTTLLRRFGCLGLPLSFCVLLMGCDSQSTAAPVADDTLLSTQAAQDSTAQRVASEEANTQQQDDQLEVEGEDEGQSLMAAAKTDDSVSPRRTPMISEKNADSALQATLIGDYIGMLPCSSCEGVTITLNLFADGSVLKTSVYKNPEPAQAPVVESGIYRQDDVTITIVYDTKDIETYCIQDNHLVMVNEDKTLDTDYILSRK
ncbi:copper resistance protein NlpE N-terminal domain-containing protein [Psychrobacter frigidicola]|uniref:copper resistance protein NlpE N-terminal domain-containing protein n=1 Tax=Psychrobacter frigidicola TaxID=45611 RepID=UPI001D11AC87|nr:copper resistance protein NlpE N-terminal domain-containing protein [Psychrobacter frigidicola]